ncbi:MAG: Tyrosyl-tRNA synthetase [uncultured Thermomicrobiales bacterium]|uniref:Tyrosine--tRNA ligase n=1 Tax=uncultured Thermomicrobiales bacterium TaxID=1645740 RepID=A0A6J4UWN5_9BACT|nr:MAG: Tyrosyl-tRNA synthetase [uncultured Thermomicrobiales bacterium]
MSIATATATAPVIARAAGVNPFDYLRERGYVQNVSDADGLRAAFAEGPVTAYIGFDPSAPSLHVGNLLGVMVLATLQRFGHRPIALGGGGTALVGDPTGRTSARDLITPEAIARNLAGVLPQFGRYLDFAGGRFGDNPAALLLNNADWLMDLRYIPFLRDIGRHFSVNEMLAAETYKTRLESTGLNFVEFNYRLVQAYDFLHLFRERGCRLQMGGSDQWGNIVAGVDLIRRAEAAKTFALVTPLITTSGGEKMGKTGSGERIWLDPDQTSPFNYYQYWVNTDDSQVGNFLRFYTFLPEDRIVDLTAVSGAALREAKRVLAWEATALTHGPEAAENAQRASEALFSHDRAKEIAMNRSATATMTAELDVIHPVRVSAAEVSSGITLADVFVRSELCKSRGDARRLAAQGGLSVDDRRISDVDAPFLPTEGPTLLRAGKKRFKTVVIG